MLSLGEIFQHLINFIKTSLASSNGRHCDYVEEIMTNLPAKHDAFGGGELQAGMGASSPFELIDNKEEEREEVREYANITKHTLQQNQPSLSQVKTTEESSDDSDEQNYGESSGPPQHAGFWDHSMVNVRMHVIKLWARDGNVEFQYHYSAHNCPLWGWEGESSNNILLSPF